MHRWHEEGNTSAMHYDVDLLDTSHRLWSLAASKPIGKSVALERKTTSGEAWHYP
jgi:hypothetical protein